MKKVDPLRKFLEKFMVSKEKYKLSVSKEQFKPQQELFINLERRHWPCYTSQHSSCRRRSCLCQQIYPADSDWFTSEDSHIYICNDMNLYDFGEGTFEAMIILEVKSKKYYPCWGIIENTGYNPKCNQRIVLQNLKKSEFILPLCLTKESDNYSTFEEAKEAIEKVYVELRLQRYVRSKNKEIDAKLESINWEIERRMVPIFYVAWMFFLFLFCVSIYQFIMYGGIPDLSEWFTPRLIRLYIVLAILMYLCLRVKYES